MSRKKNKKESNAEKEISKRDPTTFSISDLESFIVHESLSEGEFKALGSCCSLHIHSQRKRLTDADGVSAKAAIDGLVHGGLLQDDSAKFVTEVSYSQEQCKKEETIIELWEVKE